MFLEEAREPRVVACSSASLLTLAGTSATPHMSGQQIDQQQTPPPLYPALPPLPETPIRRRSSRESSAPVRLGFDNVLTPSIETRREDSDSNSKSKPKTKPQRFYDVLLKLIRIIKGLTLA